MPHHAWLQTSPLPQTIIITSTLVKPAWWSGRGLVIYSVVNVFLWSWLIEPALQPCCQFRQSSPTPVCTLIQVHLTDLLYWCENRGRLILSLKDFLISRLLLVLNHWWVLYSLSSKSFLRLALIYRNHVFISVNIKGDISSDKESYLFLACSVFDFASPSTLICTVFCFVFISNISPPDP